MKTEKKLILPIIALLCITMIASTFTMVAANSVISTVNEIGVFSISVSGVGSYGAGSRYGDAFIRGTIKGNYWAILDGPTNELLELKIQVTDGGLSIRYYEGGSWKKANVPLVDTTGYWVDAEVGGTTTWTVKDESGQLKFSIKWPRGKISGSVKGCFTLPNAKTMSITGCLRGTATAQYRLTIETGDGWSHEQEPELKAKGRYGQNNVPAGDFEMELGYEYDYAAPLDMATGHRIWTQGLTEDFTLVYEGSGTNMAYLTIGSQTIQYMVLGPTGGQQVIAIHAKSKTSGSVVIENLVLNGLSIGTPDEITSIGTPNQIRYLTIMPDGLDLANGFTLEGDVTFTWSSTSAERPCFEIDVQY